MRKLLLLLGIFSIHATTMWEIVIPSYNNEKWCIKNIESVVRQTYLHWHATIIVDCSTDNTAKILQEYIDTHNLHSKITLIVNTKRRGALANIYAAVITCPDSTVIGMLDGDDWLARDNVLESIAAVYDTQEIWLTFGSFRFWPENRNGWCKPYAQSVIERNAFRKVPYVLPSHFKTFYAWLFKRIKPADLLYEGKFYQTCSDLAIMFPMIEMAGRHHQWISDVTYVYNTDNPLNDFKTNFNEQMMIAEQLRNKKPYLPLRSEQRS